MTDQDPGELLIGGPLCTRVPVLSGGLRCLVGRGSGFVSGADCWSVLVAGVLLLTGLGVVALDTSALT